MKRLMTQFSRRETHPAGQFVKYAIAGALATAVTADCINLIYKNNTRSTLFSLLK